MRFKNRDNIVLGGALLGLGVVGFVINYIKSRNVDNRVKDLKKHVETNFLEFSQIYNNHIDFESDRTKFIFDQIDEVVDEVGSCYKHIEALEKNRAKLEEVVDEVI